MNQVSLEMYTRLFVSYVKLYLKTKFQNEESDKDLLESADMILEMLNEDI